MKTKIYITGSSGFIGFHSAKKLLDKGFKVHGLDSMNNYYDLNLKKSRLKILKKYKNFSFTKGKLESEKTISRSILKFKPSIIIHLAAQAGVRYSIDNPDAYLQSNIIGTFNIMKFANKIKVKHLIIGSSSSVYGANKKFPFQEIDKTDRQISFYAATKKSTESLAHSYSSLWKLPITMLRFFTVYGPWGRPDMALFKFTKKIINNKSIDLFNNGNHVRDFTYIDDIVDSLYKIITKIPKTDIPYEIINIGSGKPRTLNYFLKMIEKVLSKKSKKKYLEYQKGDVLKTSADISKLKKKINFKTNINFEDSIKNFIKWYKKFYS